MVNLNKVQIIEYIILTFMEQTLCQKLRAIFYANKGFMKVFLRFLDRFNSFLSGSETYF